MTKILIIDDESSVIKMLSKLLERNNYEVISATDGNKGVRLFKEHNPDIIITDLIMPEKEGLEMIREIKQLKSDAKIIAISGGGANDPKMYLSLAAKFGAARTLTKPIDTKLLISTIEELLI